MGSVIGYCDQMQAVSTAGQRLYADSSDPLADICDCRLAHVGSELSCICGSVRPTRRIQRFERTVMHRSSRRDAAHSSPTAAKDDITDYDDPAVRKAAIEAMGRYNGAVVAIDPSNGRILSVVNQKLAFSSGFIPCSTIKPVIAVAALQEGVVTRDTMIRVAARKYLNLTEALAHSNNAFFEELGRRMGFDTVSHYGRLLGLGELAGYQIPEEHPGGFPTAPPAFGGVARMSSFGEGIQMTPLQLGALASSIANGGTLYYLQYPRTPEEQGEFLAAREAQPEYRSAAAGSSRRNARRGALWNRAPELYFRATSKRWVRPAPARKTARAWAGLFPTRINRTRRSCWLS